MQRCRSTSLYRALVILPFLLLAVASPDRSSDAASSRIYTGERFSIEIPRSWDRIRGRTPQTRAKFASPGGATCAVIVGSMPKRASAAQVQQDIMSSSGYERAILGQYTDAQLLRKDPIFLSDRPAVNIEIAFTYRTVDQRVRMQASFFDTWRNGRIYRLLCSTARQFMDKDLATTFDSIARSFVITR